MKLTADLLSKLTKLSRINNSIVLTEGNVLGVKQTDAHVADVILEEAIPAEAAIYDLPLFIKTLGLFNVDNTKLEFSDSRIIIKSKSQKASYLLTEKRLIDSCAPSASVQQVASSGKLGEELLSFELSGELLAQITSNAKTLGLDHISFAMKQGVLTVTICDKNNPGENSIETVVAQADSPEFEYVFLTEDFMKIPASIYNMTFYKDVASFTLISDNFNMFLCADAEFTTKVT